MSTKAQRDALMDEDGIRITPHCIKTPKGEFALKDVVQASSKIHRPLWGPFLLASLGTLVLVAAMQTMFWGDWLAAGVMLLGGIYWRVTGTRYVLVLKTASKSVDAWYAETSEQRDRALALIQRPPD